MVAQGQPVVWIVDDAQWLDRSSVQTIGFVSRRLLAERVVIVIAARDTGEDGELAGLPELRLAGLSTEDAGTLFDSVVAGPTDPAVRDRIIAETRGNPLALLELPRAWTTAELVEGLAESARVPVTGHLELAFAKRLGELPPDTQTFLALAAAEPKGDPALLWSAAQQLGTRLECRLPSRTRRSDRIRTACLLPSPPGARRRLPSGTRSEASGGASCTGRGDRSCP